MLQADIVIQLGNRFISKRINQFLAEFKNEYWIVDKIHKRWILTTNSHTRFVAKIHHWLRAHPPLRQKPWL